MSPEFPRNWYYVPGILLLVFLMSGCGYRFTPSGDATGRDIRKVYVGVFANNTVEANIETAFRNAFIVQITAGRRFKVVSSEEGADILLKGDIRNLTTAHLAYRGDNLAVEKRLTVTLSLTMEEKVTKKVIWREENFSQWGDYVVEGATGQEGQKKALVKLANDAAERAYRMMTTDF